MAVVVGVAAARAKAAPEMVVEGSAAAGWARAAAPRAKAASETAAEGLATAGLATAAAGLATAMATAVAGWATAAASWATAVPRVMAAARAVGRTDSSYRLPAAPPRLAM